jgi:inosine-uridine nucleoside N-ribohydrolase
MNLGKYSEEPYGGYSNNKPINMRAVDFIANQVYRYPNEITIFALGPCTNIALFVREYPDLVPYVKKIIYMGGAFEVPGNTTPAAEFNVWFDPEAEKICFRAPFKEQIIVPLDVCEKVFYTKNEYERIITGPQTPLVRMFKDLHGPIFDKNPDYKSFVWDSITAAIFLQPDIITKFEDRYVDVDTAYGPDYGRTLSYKEINEQAINEEDKFGPDYGKSIGNGKGFPIGSRKAKIIFEINTSKFWELFVNMMQK